MERGQVTIFIIVGVFLVGSIVAVVWLGGEKEIELVGKECVENEDCVPNECCNADLCVPESEGPDCLGDILNPYDDVVCAPNCKNYGTLKVGCLDPGIPGSQGSCVCEDGFCKVER